MRIFFILFSLLLVSCAGLHPRYHEVAAGESLNTIATHYRITVAALKKYNLELAMAPLKPGAKLYIPYESRPEWNEDSSGDGNTDLADANTSGSDDADANPDRAPASDHPYFSWPLIGTLSSAFGIRHHRPHQGIDIAAAKGTPVRASRAGHVIYAGNVIRGYGNMVIIKHMDSYSTVYAHLSRFKVKKGQFVARGQLIGLVGHTGHAFGNHLHFEIRDGRTPVDPMSRLQARYARRD